MRRVGSPAWMSVIACLALFACSVLLRIPFLQEYAVENQGWQSAHTMVSASLWQKHGLIAHHAVPLSSVGPSPLEPTYYLSYPPLGFILPYVFLGVLGLPVSMGNVQAFNLLVQLCAALGVFAIVRKLGAPYAAAVAAFAAYVFTPASLLFHSEYAVADTVMQPFWIGTLYAVLLALENPTRSRLALLFLFQFLFAYTEWLSVPFVLTATVAACFGRFRDLRGHILVALWLGTACALLLTAAQYASMVGWDALLEEWLRKFAMRSGQASSLSPWGLDVASSASYLRVLTFYVTTMIPIVLFVFLLGLLRNRYIARQRISSSMLVVMLLLGAPVALHHALLFNWTAVHAFSVLKTTAPLSVAVGLLLIPSKRSSIFFLTALFVSVSALTYAKFVESKFYSAEYDISRRIREETLETDVIFVWSEHYPTWGSNDQPLWGGPQFAFYAQRTILAVASAQNVLRLMQEQNITQAILYSIGDDGIIGRRQLSL